MTNEQREPHLRGAYRFGPAASLGLLGPITTSQLVCITAGVTLGVGSLFVLPVALAPLGLIACIAGGLVAFAPTPHGVPLVDALRLRLAARIGITGRLRFRAELAGAPGVIETPASWGRLRVVTHEVCAGSVGVLIDDGARTASVCLSVRSDAVCLLSAAEREARVASWGALLAGLAREDRLVRRVSWVERTLRAEGEEAARWFAENACAERDAPSLLDYAAAFDEASESAVEHSCFVTITLDARRCERRAGESRDQAAARVAVAEAALAQAQLVEAGLVVRGALAPRRLAEEIRLGVDPAARHEIARQAARGGVAGCAVEQAGPLAIDEAWDHVRLDSAYAATFWIARWPLTDVDELFLFPLLGATSARRSVAVACEPVAPSVAHRRVEAELTNEEASRMQKEQSGYRETARTKRRASAVAERERELADGHALYRFSGHVSVYGNSLDELETACAQVVAEAQQAGLELRRMVGRQADALAETLPGLARGVSR